MKVNIAVNLPEQPAPAVAAPAPASEVPANPILEKLVTECQKQADDRAAVKAKQTTRMLKYMDAETGYTVRLSAHWAKQGAPICPINGKPMIAA